MSFQLIEQLQHRDNTVSMEQLCRVLKVGRSGHYVARKVVNCWAMAPDMRVTLVCQALQLATAQRQPATGLVVHSDCGSQYASDSHRVLLNEHGLVASMSREENC